MINRLKAIIVDENYREHDYSSVLSQHYWDGHERSFDFILLDGSEDINDILYENRDFDSIITIGGTSNKWYDKLCYFGFQVRKKWCNIMEFNPEFIANTIISTFIHNSNRKTQEGFELFSFFTCTFNTPKWKLDRLYNSMVNQEYIEWNWFILDDSTDSSVVDIIDSYRDYRITVIKNVTNHGSIGFNKHLIAMACDGEYLVEVDHDDELTPDCLKYLKMAFDKYEDVDFVYSDEIEDIGGVSMVYPDGWGFGEGSTRNEIVNGVERCFSVTPKINPYSVRTIYSQPNHVRCWKSSFYHKIGGHNSAFGVMDDCELLIRTFLNGKMAKVEKVLYIQYEEPGERGKYDGNTQSNRFLEIQRMAWVLKMYYDKAVHDRIIELGYKDTPWDDNTGQSDLYREHEPGKEIMCYLLAP